MMNNNKEDQLSLFQNENNDIEILNISSLGIFQRCPLEYKYRFLPRNEKYDPQGYEILLGRVLHSITADFLKNPTRDRKTKANIQEYKERLEKHIYPSNKQYYDIAITSLNNIINGPLSKLSVQAIEYSFKKQIAGMLLKGRIDCIGREDNHDLIIDFKIDRSELEHHEDQCNRYLQLIFYYIGIKDKFRLKDPRIAYYFYSNGLFEMIELSERLLREGFDRIMCLHKEQKKSSKYPPKKSCYCSTCAIRHNGLCPIWKKY